MSVKFFDFRPGGWEVVSIVSVILILFGAKKIPEITRGLGKGFSKVWHGCGPRNDLFQHPRPFFCCSIHQAEAGARCSISLSSPNEARPILTKYFVVAHLTVPDSAGNAGASRVLEKIGGSGQGVPFHAFLNPKGEMIVNSRRNGQGNIGYPYEPHEIDWFLEMLKKAAPAMTEAEAKVIETKLRSYKRK